MLERETEIIIGILAEKTIGARESITLGEALASDIPSGVKTFIQREVHRTLASDLRTARHFTRINVQHPPVSHLLKSVLDGVSLEYTFPRSEFLSTLDSAVNFQENYLCRPQWTLLNFMFDGVDYLSRDLLMEKFGYFLEYTYFSQLVDRLMRKRQWTGISKEAFQILLRNIDDGIVRHFPPEDLALLTKPIFDFLFLESVSTNDMSKAIPVKPLLVFFGEKGTKDVVERLEWLVKEASKEHVTLPELIGIITHVRSGAPQQLPEPPAGDETAVEQPASEAQVFDLHPEREDSESSLWPPDEEQTQEEPAAAAAVATTDESPSPEPPPSEDSESILSPPDEQRTQEEPAAAAAVATTDESPAAEEPPSEDSESILSPPGEQQTHEEPAAAVATTDESPAAESSHATEDSLRVGDVMRQNVALSLTFAGLEKEQTPELPDLHSLIPSDRRQDFIRRIFKDDDAYFNGIIWGLNKAQTWQEAARFLKDFYESNEIDPFAEETIVFTDTIHRRYQLSTRNPS